MPLSPHQLTLFPAASAPAPQRHASTFTDNMRRPVHRWFRYSAGFSATWAEQTISERSAQGLTCVLDPFAGSATTLLAAQDAAVESIGIESHPFVARVARAKLLRGSDPAAYRAFARAVLAAARKQDAAIDEYPPLIRKCYRDETLADLDRLRRALAATMPQPGADEAGDQVRSIPSAEAAITVNDRGGADDRIGTPVAIIESAWRRYTKHSRNKAQEIQGAVLPIRDHLRFAAPFVGCFLAGVYTAGALGQLRSLGFHLLYFDYATIVQPFKTVGIDARFDEATTDAEFVEKQSKWAALTPKRRAKIWTKLLDLNKDQVLAFMVELERAVKRQICAVRIIPLHGVAHECTSVAEAIDFVRAYDESTDLGPLLKYEVQIRYDNGDRIDAQFQDRVSAIEFLEQYRSGNWTPGGPGRSG